MTARSLAQIGRLSTPSRTVVLQSFQPSSFRSLASNSYRGTTRLGFTTSPAVYSEMARSRKPVQAKADPHDIPLAQPDRSGPKGKSLMDLAVERQDELWKQADTLNAQRGRQSATSRARPEQAAGPNEHVLANTLLMAVTLSMVHFTLDVLVYHQYAEKIYWTVLLRRTATFAPAFGVVLYMLSIPFALRLGVIRQLFLLAASCAAGCYLIRTTNEEPYIAVMTRAPPLGAFLIWSYLEMRLPFGIAGLALSALYLWYHHFSII